MKRQRQLLFSCNINPHLSSDNLPGDGFAGKLDPVASNVPAFPSDQHDSNDSLLYTMAVTLKIYSETKEIFDQKIMLIKTF